MRSSRSPPQARRSPTTATATTAHACWTRRRSAPTSSALRSLERLGVRPSGYRTPSWEPSPRTFDLLAEYGLEYDSSLMDDDRPYLRPRDRRRAARRASAALGLDDWNQYAYLPTRAAAPAPSIPRRARSHLEGGAGRNEAARLPVRADDASVSERPAGPGRRLRTLIEHALGCGDVEFVSCAEAARRAAEDAELPGARSGGSSPIPRSTPTRRFSA